MANNRTITSANAVFMLGFTGIYPVAQQLQSFMADAAFAADAVDVAENVLGVDGIMTSGWIPRIYAQTISLQAGSPSEIIFETVQEAQDTAQEIFQAFGTIQFPATGRKYTLINGVLTRFAPFPESRKVLQGRVFTMTWNNISPAAM
jgi:hypothetical protein